MEPAQSVAWLEELHLISSMSERDFLQEVVLQMSRVRLLVENLEKILCSQPDLRGQIRGKKSQIAIIKHRILQIPNRNTLEAIEIIGDIKYLLERLKQGHFSPRISRKIPRYPFWRGNFLIQGGKLS